MKKSVQRFVFWPYGVALFVVLLVLDQVSKFWIAAHLQPGASMEVFPGLWWTYLQNTGTAWSLFRDMNAGFIWLSILAFGVLVFFYDSFETILQKVSYTLLMVGLWGNLLDRVSHGFVVDFIDVHWWPVFNVADSCITIGIVLFIVAQFLQDRAVKKVKS